MRANDRQAALLVSVAVGIVVAVVTTATFWWIYELATGPDRRAAALAAAAPYDPSSGVRIITAAARNAPTDGREPWLGQQAWLEGVQAGQAWVQQNPNTLNVQVLTGMNSAQIWGYMQQHVSGALGVSCQYCHNVQNFAADTIPAKITARNMLRMVGQLNAEYVVNLPNWKGNYVQCATCHQGQPQNMPAVNDQFTKSVPPINVTVNHLNEQGEEVLDPAQKPAEIRDPLALKDAIMFYVYNYQVWRPFNQADPESGRGSMALTFEGGPTQEQVNINQTVMNYQGWSLNVGCNYCHNSRNFVAYEGITDPKPGSSPSNNAPSGNLPNPQYAYNKLKAQQMFLMTTWLAANWETFATVPKTDPAITNNVGEFGGFVGNTYYRRINGQVYTVPGCYTCHRGNAVPRAAINQAELPPGEAGIVILPTQLRGGGR
jgi:photosynthetic reaction center cytochrome c subunit